MGSRNNPFVKKERADVAMQRVLREFNQPTMPEPPPDLVSRTLKRLPNMPPAQAARMLRRKQRVRTLVRVVLFLCSIFIAVVGCVALLGGTQWALLFGNGESGVSRIWLMSALALKPLTHTIGLSQPSIVAVALVFITISMACWWWLIRSTPAIAPLTTGRRYGERQ
jgi:hypothetical protein